MNIRKFQVILLATALAGMGSAFAQQAGMGASGSVATTPAAGKAAAGVRGNAELTSDVALAGTPRQGSPGTQSGVAVTDTMSMGAGPAIYSMSSQSLAGLSRSQLRELERYNALR